MWTIWITWIIWIIWNIWISLGGYFLGLKPQTCGSRRWEFSAAVPGRQLCSTSRARRTSSPLHGGGPEFMGQMRSASDPVSSVSKVPIDAERGPSKSVSKHISPRLPQPWTLAVAAKEEPEDSDPWPSCRTWNRSLCSSLELARQGRAG
jgi:hypothetical protein